MGYASKIVTQSGSTETSAMLSTYELAKTDLELTLIRYKLLDIGIAHTAILAICERCLGIGKVHRTMKRPPCIVKYGGLEVRHVDRCYETCPDCKGNPPHECA